MTKIEVTEESFGKANTFYVLAWVVTALVIITAFVDFRSYQRDVKINGTVIERYSDLERDAEKVARKLRTSIYLAPNFSSEKAGIENLRRLRSEVLGLVLWLDTNFTRKTPDLSVGDRLIIRPSLNFMKAMLLLNDAADGMQGHVADEPSLLLAEHEAGSYLVADEIEDLRIEDAARYLWLSSLDLDVWKRVLMKHKEALSLEAPRDDMVGDFKPIVDGSSSPRHREIRNDAYNIWKNWLTFVSATSANDVSAQQDARQRTALTLAQTSEFLDQALKKRAELNLQAGGETSTVEIPILAVPLQLRDAIVVAPWVLAFCSLSILIYTRRAFRYSPTKSDPSTVIGNVPSFYAGYGLHHTFGIIVAVLLLWLPPVLLALIPPLLLPGLVSSWDMPSIIYFLGVGVAIFLSLFTLLQVPAVFKLVDDGIATKETETA